MSIEDYEAEVQPLDAELADIDEAISLELATDVQAELEKTGWTAEGRQV